MSTQGKIATAVLAAVGGLIPQALPRRTGIYALFPALDLSRKPVKDKKKSGKRKPGYKAFIEPRRSTRASALKPRHSVYCTPRMSRHRDALKAGV